MAVTDIINPIQMELPDLTSRVSGPIADMDFGSQAHAFIELSILAYVDEATAEKWGQVIGFDEVHRISYNGDQAVTIFSNEKDVVVSFRGTYNVKNFLEDVDYTPTTDGKLPGKVHKGFLLDFEKLWPSILPSLDSKKGVWATGHSLGGSLAAIAAVRASRRAGPNLNGLFTFGQPRIGDLAYVSNLFTPSHRWVDYHDLVPHLPPRWMRFTHFGQEHYIDANGLVIMAGTLGGSMKRIMCGFLGLLKYNIGDHNVFKYRNAVIKTNQERANGKR